MLSQFAGVRLMTLGDGVERGIRMLEFRTGTGLRFTVLVDRALDIADCEYRGAAIGWHSPAGFRHPGLHEYEGEGGLAWLRSFSGLIVTCGLDHILFMHSQDAAHYHYAHRKTVDSSIHGRVVDHPGAPHRLRRGLGRRRVHAVVRGRRPAVDGVRRGPAPDPAHRGQGRRQRDPAQGPRGQSWLLPDAAHALYHINVGHPVLAEGSRYLAPIAHAVWAAHAEALPKHRARLPDRCRRRRPPFHEQVWEHWLAADGDGQVPVALVNDGFDGGRGLGFLVETRKTEFPCQFQWQNYQAGQYAMGFEPSTNHVFGKPFAEERGELIWLEHGEERSYTTRMAVLDGRDEIAAMEQRIRAIAAQPRHRLSRSRPGAGTPLAEPWSSRARPSCSPVPPAASAPRARWPSCGPTPG